MIRGTFIKAVLYKELLDTVRDKKTLLINIGLPVVVWPLMTFFVVQFSSVQVIKQESQISKIALIGDSIPGLAEKLGKEEKVEIADLDSHFEWDLDLLASLENDRPKEKIGESQLEEENPIFKQVESLVEDSTIEIVLAQKAFPVESIGGFNYKIWLLFDSTNPESTQAALRVKTSLTELKSTFLDSRLLLVNLKPEVLKPLDFVTTNVAIESKTTADAIGKVLPLILIFLVVLGGFYPAISMTAGEKEHGTLPTILCAPISHLELLLGKYFAILIIALAGVSVNILSISAVALIGLADLPLNISPIVLLYIFVSLIPVAMLFSAMFMAVAIFANSFREGQNLLSPVTLLAILPAYSAMLPGFKLTPVTAITPGFNIALLIKEILIRSVEPELIFLTLISNLAWTLGILVLTARLFESEQVLLSGKPSISDLFTLDRDALPHPNPYLSTVLFLFFLVGTFYLSGALLGFGIIILIPVLQLGLMAGVPLFLSNYFRMDIPKVFRLRRPKFNHLVGALLIGSSIFIVVEIFSNIIEVPEAYQKLLMESLQLKDPSISTPLLLLLIAVLPGVCEELAFRGIILTGFLKGFTSRQAILLTGLCFACAHFSIYKMIPLFILGVVLSYVAWKTQSIWPGITIHVINNGIAVIIARYEEQLTLFLDGKEYWVESSITFFVAAAITCVGLRMIHSK